MLAFTPVFLAFIASSWAFTVTEPTNSTSDGWTTDGPNTLSWTTVSTDPSNFTVVLSNEQQFPPVSQTLDTAVDASSGSITVTIPSGGLPSGTGYQVNLVRSASELTTILAQSGQFTITDSSSSSSSSSGSSSQSSSVSGSSTSRSSTSVRAVSSATSAASSASGSTGASGSSGTTGGSSTDTGATTSTTAANGASVMGMQATLLAGVALVGAYLF